MKVVAEHFIYVRFRCIRGQPNVNSSIIWGKIQIWQCNGLSCVFSKDYYITGKKQSRKKKNNPEKKQSRNCCV